MISPHTIEQAVSRLVATANPTKVVLFGSYARGDAGEDSDLDLLVIEPCVISAGLEMVRLRNAVGHIGIGVDVLVCSEADAEKRGQVPGTVVYWALKEGKVLYESAH